MRISIEKEMKGDLNNLVEIWCKCPECGYFSWEDPFFLAKIMGSLQVNEVGVSWFWECPYCNCRHEFFYSFNLQEEEAKPLDVKKSKTFEAFPNG